MNDLAQAVEGANVHDHPGPILEAAHLRKMFPLRSWNLSGSVPLINQE